MSSIIKVKRGTTTPTTGLAEHEIAVDTTAKRIYIGAVDGSGTLIGSAPAGSTTQVQFNNAGVLGASAALNGTYIQIDDITPSLNISCPGGTITVTSPTVVFNGGSY